jgi:hypothetical protein
MPIVDTVYKVIVDYFIFEEDFRRRTRCKWWVILKYRFESRKS